LNHWNVVIIISVLGSHFSLADTAIGLLHHSLGNPKIQSGAVNEKAPNELRGMM
jgi:hypothetical protein